MLFAIVFFRLWYLQVLTGERARRRRARTAAARSAIEAPRGDIVDRDTRQLVRRRRRRSCSSCRRTLPEQVRKQADDYRKALAVGRERERLAIRDASTTRSSRQLRDDGRKSTKAEQRERDAAASRGDHGRAGADPADPADEPELAELYRRIGETSSTSARRRSTSA